MNKGKNIKQRTASNKKALFYTAAKKGIFPRQTPVLADFLQQFNKGVFLRERFRID